MTTIRHLEKRVERLENILIELGLHKNRCKYIYVEDIKQAMLRRRLIKEKTTIVKDWRVNINENNSINRK